MTRARVIRLCVLAAVIVTLLVVAEVTGLRRWLTIARIREITLRAGALGVLAYCAAFILGELIHVPGLLFCAAGVAIWGRLWGGVIAWGASVLSITASFLLIRAIGGNALSELRWSWMKKILAQLETHPLRTVALLRAVLVISPPVTYALALSPVRFGPFFVGSAIGLAPPMVLVAIFLDFLLRWLG